MPVWLEKQNLMHSAKAGRFVGLADCYAALVWAVKSIVAFRLNSAYQL